MTEACTIQQNASGNRATGAWADDKQYWFVVLLLVIGSACFVHAIYYLWIGLTGPALDFFSFRQTQTAISAYWAWRDGFRLAYETPVLGYPWSIPFEFPIYQWLMVLARYAGIPFDVSGRLISFGFYIACLLPIWSVTRSLKLEPATFLIIAILFLSCPLYVFYSRTILIESCALFFGLAWLAALGRFLGQPNYGALAWTIALGSLAVLVKSTTFPAFAVLGGFLMLSRLFTLWRGDASFPRRLDTLLFGCVAFFAPLAIGYAWVMYSDAVKIHNVLGAMLTSQSLGVWNFGTLTQRLSFQLWNDVISTRALSDIFGNCSVLALITTGALFTSRRHLLLGLATAVAFLLPFLVFTNLHIVHSYYQYANAIFALATVGLAIGHIARSGHRGLAGLILIGISLGQVTHFERAYAPVFASDLRLSDINRIAQLAKANTTQEDGLMVLGQDWSSALPYYSERKALVIPGWAPLPVFQKILANPEMFLGGVHLGAILYCPEVGYGDRSRLVDAFVARRKVVAEAGTCKLLSPNQDE